jgi:hypothetical protein
MKQIAKDELANESLRAMFSALSVGAQNIVGIDVRIDGRRLNRLRR